MQCDGPIHSNNSSERGGGEFPKFRSSFAAPLYLISAVKDTGQSSRFGTLSYLIQASCNVPSFLMVAHGWNTVI